MKLSRHRVNYLNLVFLCVLRGSFFIVFWTRDFARKKYSFSVSFTIDGLPFSWYSFMSRQYNFQATNAKYREEKKRGTSSTRNYHIYTICCTTELKESSAPLHFGVHVIGLPNMNNYIYTIIYAKDLTALKL